MRIRAACPPNPTGARVTPAVVAGLDVLSEGEWPNHVRGTYDASTPQVIARTPMDFPDRCVENNAAQRVWFQAFRRATRVATTTARHVLRHDVLIG